MTILDKIVMLIHDKGITEKTFLDDLKLNRTTLSDWKKGKHQSYMKYLPQIAQYFNVSIDYLSGNTDKKEKPLTAGGVELNDDEIEFIKALRALSPEEKKLIYRAADIVPRDIDL